MDPATAPAEPAPKPRDRRGGLPFALVFGVFVALLAFGIAFAVRIHKSYVGFERAAARHVPPDASLVLRWDVEKVSLFEPTRRFLLPLLDGSAPGARPLTPSRRDRFAKESGTVFGRDLREVLVTFGPGPGDWSALLAGSFASGDLVAAAERTLAAEGVAARRLGPQRIALPSGAAVGQAEDGVLVVASNAGRLDAALPVREVGPDVPRIGAGALVARRQLSGLPHGGAETFVELGYPDAVRAEARWGSPLPVTLELTYPEATPSDGRERIRRALGALLAEDFSRLEHQYAPIAVQPAGNRRLRVDLLLDDMALERVAKRASEAVETALGLRPAQE